MSTFHLVKVNKRLHIACDNEIVYTPPSFLRLPNREALTKLAEYMNQVGYRDINAIIEFESSAKRN